DRESLHDSVYFAIVRVEYLLNALARFAFLFDNQIAPIVQEQPDSRVAQDELHDIGLLTIDRCLLDRSRRHTIPGEIAEPAICKDRSHPQTLGLRAQKRSQATLILLPRGFSVVAFAYLSPRRIDVDADAVRARNPVRIIPGSTVAKLDAAG